MKYHFLPYLLNSVFDTELVSMRVVLQTRKTFQWQSRAGDGVGVAAGDDVVDAALVGDLADRDRHRRIDVAEQEIDLVAVDQLARLLHRGAGIGAGRILDQQLHLAAEDAALGVDLLDREFAADLLVLAELGVGAGERIVEADLDRLLAARLDDERASGLQDACGRSGLENSAAPRITSVFLFVHRATPFPLDGWS